MTDTVIDSTGKLRRLGTLIPSSAMLAKAPYNTFEDIYPEWDDSQILQALTHPDRRKMRQLFDRTWKLDQHQFGSCNGFAAAGGLGKARYLRGLQDHYLFSGAYLYSLMNGNRDEGSLLIDGLNLLKSSGCCRQEFCNYNQIYRNQYNTANADADAAKFKGLNLLKIRTPRGLRTAGAIGYMIIACVHVGNNFMRVTNGYSGLDRGPGNHSILLQDMQLIDNIESFDHDGSWGADYGTNGNSWLTMSHFTDTMRYHQFYAISSTVEGTS
jgi:hypothetical protein